MRCRLAAEGLFALFLDRAEFHTEAIFAFIERAVGVLDGRQREVIFPLTGKNSLHCRFKEGGVLDPSRGEL